MLVLALLAVLLLDAAPLAAQSRVPGGAGSRPSSSSRQAARGMIEGDGIA